MFSNLQGQPGESWNVFLFIKWGPSYTADDFSLIISFLMLFIYLI